MTHALARADAARLPFPERAFDLVIGSPPYGPARKYYEDGEDLSIARPCGEWVEWMLRVTAESLRVSRGLVLWVCSGWTKDRNYQPGPEGLLWEWWKLGGKCHCYRPVIWHRNGISGSGGDEWFRADTEYVLAFKRPGTLPWADNTANGHPPKWAPGGEMSHRLSSGARVNQRGGRETSGGQTTASGKRQKSGRPSHRYGKMREIAEATDAPKVQAALDEMPPGAKLHTKRDAGGQRVQVYIPPDLANPGNFFHTRTGGGQLGHSMAHDNEAPYPVEVPAWFIASHCPPGGLVLDPFSGSGSTGQAALELGRRFVGCDLRQSQCLLSRKRLGTVTPSLPFGDPDA